MHRAAVNLYEMLAGALIFGLGLLFLTYQSRMTESLIKLTMEEVLEEGYIYQQYNTVDLSFVSGQELYAIIMANRELPIVIDGRLIEPEDTDYDLYFSLIKEGLYRKSYSYDADRNIAQVIYEYAGL